MRLDAALAPLDHGSGEPEQLEVHRRRAMLGQTVHAQPGRKLRKLLFARHVNGAIVDVGHRHDGGRDPCGLDRRIVDRKRRLLLDGVQQNGVSAGDRGRDGGAPFLRGRQVRQIVRSEQGAEIELYIPRIVGQRLPQFFQGSHGSAFVIRNMVLRIRSRKAERERRFRIFRTVSRHRRTMQSPPPRPEPGG